MTESTTPTTDGPDEEPTGFRAAFARPDDDDDTEGHVRVTPTLPTQGESATEDDDDVEGHQKLVP